MAGLSGDFDLDGRTFQYEIIEVHTEDGETVTGSEIEDSVEDADRIFYKVTGPDGEEFHRWLAGPFEDIDGIADAIGDEIGSYEDLFSS